VDPKHRGHIVSADQREERRTPTTLDPIGIVARWMDLDTSQPQPGGFVLSDQRCRPSTPFRCCDSGGRGASRTIGHGEKPSLIRATCPFGSFGPDEEYEDSVIRSRETPVRGVAVAGVCRPGILIENAVPLCSGTCLTPHA
jgi:hypothetical protein